MLCPLKNSELSNKNLFDLLEQKLPFDVLYHIYTYCNVDEKRQIRQHFHEKHPIIMMTVCLITALTMYFLGYLLTRKNLGVYIILNFLLGYLVCTALCLILLLLCIPFKMCEETQH